MSVDFTELSGIKGVTESFLYSKWGELLAPQLPYTAARIKQFGKEVALCSFFLEKIGQEVDFIELIYEERRLICRMSQNFFILVNCETSADTALIKLTLNIMHEEIKVDKDIQNVLRKSSGKKDLLADAQQEPELYELLVKTKITAEEGRRDA